MATRAASAIIEVVGRMSVLSLTQDCSWCVLMLLVLCFYYVSQFTVETYCFADGRCVFKQPQSVIYNWNQYDEEISKKCKSVRLSVRPSVCNANKKVSFIIDSRKINRISDERAYHPLQENEEIFSKKNFSNILE